MAHPAPTSDWIEWTGGKCPVAEHAGVIIRLRCGEEDDDGEDWAARDCDWLHRDEDPENDIVAYRVVQA